MLAHARPLLQGATVDLPEAIANTNWIAVLLGGLLLWAFFALARHPMGRPQSADQTSPRSGPSKYVKAVADFAVSLGITAAIAVAQHMRPVGTVGGAATLGAMMAAAPVVVLLAEGICAHALADRLKKSLVVLVGLVAASITLFTLRS